MGVVEAVTMTTETLVMATRTTEADAVVEVIMIVMITAFSKIETMAGVVIIGVPTWIEGGVEVDIATMIIGKEEQVVAANPSYEKLLQVCLAGIRQCRGTP